MEYTLLDKIVIERPILFLCGPHYDKNNKSDRRVILQEKIYDEYKNKFLPLVIDDFLTENNVKGSNISIQLMEEICAAASYKTYIFLDTMSSATELGIFANSANENQIKVYIPKTSDIYNKGNVGFFVREVVLKKHTNKVNCLEYRPGIERKALATDYIVEHYKFVNDILPLNIEKDILNDPIFRDNDEHLVELIDNDIIPRKPFQICYHVVGNNLHINLSLRMLFYITISIISCVYKDHLKKKNKDFTIFNIDEINNDVKKCIRNHISGKTKIDLSTYTVHCNTILNTEEKDLIYHITKFVHLYYLYSQFHNIFLIPNPLGRFIEEINVGDHPFSLFHLSDQDIELVNDINKNKQLYYEHLIIKKKNKKRDIIKYRNNDYGNMARELHNRILQILNEKYKSNDYSFAYKKGKNIKQCVEMHLTSSGFLKYDIKKFFNSIKVDKLADKVMDEFNIDKRFKEELNKVLGICFYENQLPLGLTLSPILSDIYLDGFDKKIVNKLNNEGLIYTRYADDILISSINNISEQESELIGDIINNGLSELGLVINNEKKLQVNMQEDGNYIRYVGLNIIRGVNGNYISVGKTYINDLAKECLSYCSKFKKLNLESLSLEEKEELTNDIFYEKLIIIGKVGFIRQIEGIRGLERIRKRLKKHDVGSYITELIA